MTGSSSDGAARPMVGTFTLDVSSDTWAWSDAMYRIHGLAPGEVVPTTDLLLSHQHPDDRDLVREAYAKAAAIGEPFSLRHRLFDLQGRERVVLVVGDGEFGEDGRVAAVHGSVVDLTDAIRADATEMARDFFEQAQEHRSNIDQTKGALMLAYGLTDEEAFSVLRWHSQHANIKLRDLAAEFMHRLAAEPAIANARQRVSSVLGVITDQTFVVPPELVEGEPETTAGR